MSESKILTGRAMGPLLEALGLAGRRVQRVVIELDVRCVAQVYVKMVGDIDLLPPLCGILRQVAEVEVLLPDTTVVVEELPPGPGGSRE